MTMIKTDRARPIDLVIDYFGETRGTGAGLRPTSIEPARRIGAAQ